MFMPSNALNELTDIDIISRGEGEIVTNAIAECIKGNSSLSSIENITYRDNERIVDSPRSFDRTTDLDKFPSPYLDGTINLSGKEEAMIFTSRGCRVLMPILHLALSKREEDTLPFYQPCP